MAFSNFICYRGNTLGEMFGGTLYAEISNESEIFGKTYFSPQQKETGSFLNDIPHLMLNECQVFIIMLTKGFFDDFLSAETGEINDTSITRKEIEAALQNPNMKFIPIVFKGFLWDEETKTKFEKSVCGDHSKIETALPIYYAEQHRTSVIEKIKAILQNSYGQNAIPQITTTRAKKQKGHPIVIDGIHMDLIGATKKRLEKNYHLQLDKAEMHVYISGESFKIRYLYEGTILKRRRDGIQGVFLNIITPSSNPSDTRFAYGYDLTTDEQRQQKIPFSAVDELSSMARKLYMPIPQSKKGEKFRIEIHSENSHAISPTHGVSKFLFRVPFKKKPHTNGVVKDYKFVLHFDARPTWVKCTRVSDKGKTSLEGNLIPCQSDIDGFFAFSEPYAPCPVGTIRVYTFERP